MNRFALSKNVRCGAQLAFGGDEVSGMKFEIGGTLNLSNGIISHNDLCGINVQTKNILLDDLSNTVLYFENNYNNLDTSSLSTPVASFDIEPTE